MPGGPSLGLDDILRKVGVLKSREDEAGTGSVLVKGAGGMVSNVVV